LSANLLSGNSSHGLPEMGSYSERLHYDNLKGTTLQTSIGKYYPIKDKISLSDLKSAVNIFNSSHTNRLKGLSMQNKPSQPNYVEHANNTLKVYFGKNPDRILATRSQSLMKFLNHGKSAFNHQNHKVIVTHKEPKGLESKELFKINYKKMDEELEGDWYKMTKKTTPSEVKASSKILITPSEFTQSGNALPTVPTFEISDQRKEPLNSSSGGQVTTDNLKVYEQTQTQMSQFPHMKVITLNNTKPSQSISGLKDNAMRISHEEGDRFTTDLDYSNTQFMKSSLMAKENVTTEIQKELENHSSRKIKVDNENIEEVENEGASLRALTKQDFQELTSKPFAKKKESLKSLTAGSKETSKRSSYSAISENLETGEKAESNALVEEEKNYEYSNPSKISSFNNLEKKTRKSLESIESESKEMISYNLTQEQISSVKEVSERNLASRRSSKRKIASQIPSSYDFTEAHTEGYNYNEEVFEEIEC